MKPSFRRSLHAAAGAAACSLALSVQAGLSLDQAVARDRTLRELDRRQGDAFALLPPLPDGATLAIGGRTTSVPYLLGPTVPGHGGARAVFTPVDEPTIRLRLGAAWQIDGPREGSLEGTAVALPLGPGEAYASVETRHWGPGWTGSLILDAAAPALPALGWRKTSPEAFETRWLSWLGPWNADFFIGRLGGHTEPEDPYLIGMRLQIRPLSGLELGASRTMQWGGEGRDQSLRSLLNGLIGRDNYGHGFQQEPGNQLAGFDLRYGRPVGDSEWAVYAQAIGEDEAGLMPSRLIVQAGAEWATTWRGNRLRWFGEWANLTSGDAYGTAHLGVTYRHHIYRQGYTHYGLPLGHAAGGDVKLTSTGMLVDGGRFSALVAAHAGRGSPAAQRFEPNVSLAGLNAAASVKLERASRAGLSLWWWRAGDESRSTLQAWWHTAWR